MLNVSLNKKKSSFNKICEKIQPVSNLVGVNSYQCIIQTGRDTKTITDTCSDHSHDVMIVVMMNPNQLGCCCLFVCLFVCF